ncbi:MAG: TMEM175 family protein [Planctomycetota bacterium]|nr:TMEM175 family protein [Planctomycetota bacterium]
METESAADVSAEKDTSRIEAFSDGVFSVAITLLVFDLKVPSLSGTPTTGALWRELGKLWPSYFTFITSFFSVLIIWMNHHAIFRLIRRTNSIVMFANGVLLLLVSAVPFSTALVARYMQTPAAPVAGAIYAGMFVLTNMAYSSVLLSARRPGVSMPGSAPQMSKRLRKSWGVGFPLYVVATIAAPFSIWITLGICTGLWVFWALATND